MFKACTIDTISCTISTIVEINKGKFYNSDKLYDDFFNLFKTITDKHAPIKQKRVRGNNAPFITKERRKSITDRSRQ